MPRCIRGGQYPRQALGRGQAAARRMAAAARGGATPTSCATRRPSLDAVDDLWKRDSQCVNVVLPRTGMPCEFMAMAAARTGSLGSQLLLHARRIGRMCRPAYKSDGAWTVWSSSTWDWMVNCASPRELAGCVEQGIVSCPSVVRVELETEGKEREERRGEAGDSGVRTQESGESGLRVNGPVSFNTMGPLVFFGVPHRLQTTKSSERVPPRVDSHSPGLRRRCHSLPTHTHLSRDLLAAAPCASPHPLSHYSCTSSHLRLGRRHAGSKFD